MVDRRNAATVLPIIQRCVLPGTEEHSDDWGAYRRLQLLPHVNRHRGVVHAHNFVDPRTGGYTQEVDSAWSQLKLGQKRRKGLRRVDLQSYLDERMRRQWRGGNYWVIMCNFLSIFPLQFKLTLSAGIAAHKKNNPKKHITMNVAGFHHHPHLLNGFTSGWNTFLNCFHNHGRSTSRWPSLNLITCFGTRNKQTVVFSMHRP